MSPGARLYVILTLIVAAVLPMQRAGGALPLPRYSVADVGTLGGTQSYARGINSHSDVVGSAETDATDQFGVPIRHAFIWQQGTLRDLGLLFGGSAEANAINDLGQVVGTEGAITEPPDQDVIGKAVIWDLTGGISYLPDRSARDCWDLSAALGINNRGEAVGWWLNCNHVGGAVFWKKQRGLYFLPPSRGDTGCDMAFAVNDRGEVAGTGGLYHAPLVGVLWKPGVRGQPLKISGNRPFANGNEPYSSAAAINQHGWIAGSAFQRTPQGSELERASVWTGSGFQYLPILPAFNQSRATAINGEGAVVGTLAVEAPNQPPTLEHACVWIDGLAVLDLNDRIPSSSGWVLQEAAGINDAGQIVGTGLHNGDQRGFVLTPQ